MSYDVVICEHGIDRDRCETCRKRMRDLLDELIARCDEPRRPWWRRLWRRHD